MRRFLTILFLACLAVGVTAQPQARRQQQQQQQQANKSNNNNITTRAKIGFPTTATMSDDVVWRRDIYREMNLEEAIDIIDFNKLNTEDCIVRKPESGKAIFDTDSFTLTEIKLKEPLRVSPEQSGSFIAYICIEGGVEVQAPQADGNNQMYRLAKGQLVLIPASMDECFIVPVSSQASVLEACIKVDENEKDDYINE